jgi:hypothetical protein
MTKFIFALFLCSSVAKECVPLLSPKYEFNTYRECTLYGYDYSHKLLEEMDPNNLNKIRIYTQFSCKESETI